MIPTFPEFKIIDWTDREDVQKLTYGFSPYSDFNFVSICSWNTREKMMLSKLYGNLVVLFYDYLTEAPFLSFIGKNKIPDTTRKLIEYSKLHYQTASLKLIPEQVAVHLLDADFCVMIDEDSQDYIVPVSYLSSLDVLPRSANLAGYWCQKFIEQYPQHTIRNCTVNDGNKGHYLDIFKGWAKVKNLEHWELNEYIAFERFINNAKADNTIVSMYDGEKMMGFIAYEILHDGYAVCHFAKANKVYAGVYDGLLFAVGKALREANIDYLNLEQDMGLPGLRQSKRKYKPEFYLKKYIVNLK